MNAKQQITQSSGRANLVKLILLEFRKINLKPYLVSIFVAIIVSFAEACRHEFFPNTAEFHIVIGGSKSKEGVQRILSQDDDLRFLGEDFASKAASWLENNSYYFSDSSIGDLIAIIFLVFFSVLAAIMMAKAIRRLKLKNTLSLLFTYPFAKTRFFTLNLALVYSFVFAAFLLSEVVVLVLYGIVGLLSSPFGFAFDAALFSPSSLLVIFFHTLCYAIIASGIGVISAWLAKEKSPSISGLVSGAFLVFFILPVIAIALLAKLVSYFVLLVLLVVITTIAFAIKNRWSKSIASIEL